MASETACSVQVKLLVGCPGLAAVWWWAARNFLLVSLRVGAWFFLLVSVMIDAVKTNLFRIEEKEPSLKSKEEVMEILEAFDLVGTYAGAAALLGCSHHTVARHVAARDAGRPIAVRRRKPRLTEPFEEKIAEWVERSEGKIRGDVIHRKLVKMGYEGSRRTTAYAVKRAKVQYQANHVRVHKPWVAEPGAWLQYDFGDGPVIDGKKTVLFLAWLAWSRFRDVIPLRDRSMPQVLAALDHTFRLLGGVPTYVLSDNEKTLTTGHVAGLPVRNRQIVDFAHYYGTVFHSCMPFDPQTKGGVERSVGIAKADLVPKDTNLLPDYESFGALELACEAFMEEVNAREHSVTKRAPARMLAEEQPALHTVPIHPYTVTLGVARKVPANTPMVSFDNAQYSVPYKLMGQSVWVRRQSTGGAECVVITHVSDRGPVEVARHEIALPGRPAIDQAHFPAESETVLARSIRPITEVEKEFVSLGSGAKTWLRVATSQGIARLGYKMGHAVTLAKATSRKDVDRMLDLAAQFHRFQVEDFDSILHTLNGRPQGETQGPVETEQSLAQGTTSWAGFGLLDQVEQQEVSTRKTVAA